jgi:hypothetical protein
MLDREQRPFWSDRTRSALDSPARELGGSEARESSGVSGFLDAAAQGLRTALTAPRVVAGMVLIAAGVVWALARGLGFYGLAPDGIAYDLDQPPLLLVLVGIWVILRGRRR